MYVHGLHRLPLYALRRVLLPSPVLDVSLLAFRSPKRLGFSSSPVLTSLFVIVLSKYRQGGESRAIEYRITLDREERHQEPRPVSPKKISLLLI